MTGVFMSFFLDLLVAGLLLVSIVYCWRLNVRIRMLQDSRSELAQLIRQFDESTERASVSVMELQNVSKRISENLQMKIEKANFMADDLSFMIDRGSKLADQIELGVAGKRRPEAASNPGPMVVKQPQSAAPTAQVTTPVRTTPLNELQQPGAKAQQAAGSLESVLQRIASRNSGEAPARTAPRAAEQAAPATPQGAPNVRIRSRAEQELMEALKGTR